MMIIQDHVLKGGMLLEGRKRKKEKSEYEKEMLKALNTSYDHTSKEYIEPLADFVLGEERR